MKSPESKSKAEVPVKPARGVLVDLLQPNASDYVVV